MTPTDISIINQVAAKITSELVVGAGDTIDVEQMVADFAVHLPTIADALLEQIQKTQSSGEAGVHAAFPGTTTVPVGNGLTATFLPAAQAAPQAPQPIPAVADGDPATAALWQEYFADPSQWTDNRATKPSAKHPDFKHKFKKDAAGKYLVSLYLDDKKNPSWVASRFA